MPEQEEFKPISMADEDREPTVSPYTQAAELGCKYDGTALAELKEEVAGLKDLFVRRLNEDKQKAELIRTLSDGASFAFTEPFVSAIVLLLDRIERTDDDFVRSVSEELYGIINRRGVVRIEVKAEFDPALYKAVRVTEDIGISKALVTHIVRSGYTFSGRVLRPAEVAVAVPPRAKTAESDGSASRQ